MYVFCKGTVAFIICKKCPAALNLSRSYFSCCFNLCFFFVFVFAVISLSCRVVSHFKYE